MSVYFKSLYNLLIVTMVSQPLYIYSIYILHYCIFFSHISVTCERPTIDNGSVSPETITIAEGAKYTVSCDSDYILSGNSEVTCGSDGKLSTLPTCYSKFNSSCSHI